jgi:omega-3 fatty acid desaturase (delta-15 desaturase)
MAIFLGAQWSRSPGKHGSHFHPESDLFVPNEAKDVMTSTACWTAMLATLVALTFVVGPVWMLKLYVMPYWVILQTFSLVRQEVE